MISSTTAYPSANVWTQTSRAFSGLSINSVQRTVLQASTTSYDPSAMTQQLSSQVKTARSATSVLQELYQSLERTKNLKLARDSGTDAEAVKTEITKIHGAIEEMQSGLKELRSEVGSAAADRRIYNELSNAVDESLKAIGSVVEDHGRSSSRIDQALRRTLSSLGKMERLTNNLSRASIDVMRINNAYGSTFSGFPTNNHTANIQSLYELSSPLTRQQLGQLGIALDRVS